jgi:hypothetical protein
VRIAIVTTTVLRRPKRSAVRSSEPKKVYREQRRKQRTIVRVLSQNSSLSRRADEVGGDLAHTVGHGCESLEKKPSRDRSSKLPVPFALVYPDRAVRRLASCSATLGVRLCDLHASHGFRAFGRFRRSSSAYTAASREKSDFWWNSAKYYGSREARY